jgi:hypothetical protein
MMDSHAMNQSHFIHSRSRLRLLDGVTWLAAGLLSVSPLSLQPSALFADEPVKRFLSRLQDEGLYEVGLKYLDVISAQGRLPDGMKEDLPLERNLLLQESLKTMKSLQLRDERIVSIEKGYQEFLKTATSHPRRSEAQTKLGDLLLERAQTALAESRKEANKSTSEDLRNKARAGYTEALDLYAKIIEELKPLIESMKGDKIKPNDTDAKERRERYQSEYRQAQILQAKMMEFVSQTYDSQSAEWKQWLTKSEAALSAIIDKAVGSTQAGPRILSLLYRGEIQRKLEKIDEARDSLMRVADIDEPGVFRTWRAQATSGIVRLDSTAKSGKFEAAISRGDELLKLSTANDRNEPAWVDLQLAVAEARLAWAKTLDEKKDENKFRNNRKAARDQLQAILKKQTSRDPAVLDAVQKARDLLGELGIESVEKVDDKLPETKTFADAMKLGRERLDRAESAESTIPLLQKQIQTNPAVASQIQAINEDIVRDRNQAIQLYARAIQLFRDKDPREDLLEARYLSSYLLLRTERYWECVAIAQDLMVSASGTEKGEKSGGFALMGLNKLIVDATPESQMALAPPLEKLAKKLLDANPDSTEGQNAKELLIKLALLHKQYEKAEAYVAMGQNKGGGGSSILGQSLWSEYRRNSAQRRIDKTAESPEDQSQLQRAERLLKSTWDSLDPSKTDKILVAGVNALASIYLTSDRIDEALAVLNDPQKGAIKLTEGKSDIDPLVRLEALRLQLQAVVQAAGQGKLQLSADEVAAVVAKMKELSSSDDSLLTNSLRNLAFELQVKLESTKDLDEQAKLGNAFGVLIQQLVSVSSDVSTLDSAGTAIFVLASNMAKVPALAANAKPLMAIAEEAFSKVATKSVDDLVAAKRKPEEFQFKLAVSKSGAGKFEEAHAIFVQSLAKSPSTLNIQVEAARNLQRWSGGTNADLLKKALSGTEPNAKKVNQVWGWAQISKVTTSRVNDFKDIYFESRINIAKCRRMIAMTETPELRKQWLEKAVTDIRQTLLTFPELGGPESAANFNKLLMELQQDLGRPTIGLSEFKPPTPSKSDPARN